MKFFNKTSLALALSFLGAASTMSALAMTTEPSKQIHEITIEADDNPNANIMISIDGEVTNLTVSREALHNKELLAEELANEPGDIREKLLSALSGLHINSEQIHVKHHQVADNIDEQRVVIMTMDDDLHHDDSRYDSRYDKSTMMKVVKDMSKLHIDTSKSHSFEFVTDGKVAADSIVRLLSHGEYSADELDKIQQAIDEKR
ncbi:MAG: hypothetical protein HRT52_00890 [Colwellia sp.]|nr:hypothetical protein [Colwellia sp.]